MVEILSKVAKQNNITNTRLRETSKQSKLTFKKFDDQSEPPNK